MAKENEPAKLLLPYLQRADELQKHDPLVGYYCRLYAMERGLRIPQSERTKTTNALLVSLMNQLEKDKKSLTLGPDDSLHLEGFALNVFAKADKQDRAGRADLNTAKTFYAASIFFEILNQFGQLQPDLEQKQKYAAWKAADIRKAVKEGRKPVPGPPGGDDDLSVPSSTPGNEYDVEPRTEPAEKPVPDADGSPQLFDKNLHHSTERPPPSNIPQLPRMNSQSSPPSYHADDYSSQPQPPSYPTDGYSSQSFHQNPSSDYTPQNFLQNPTSDYTPQNFHLNPTSDYPLHSPPPTNSKPDSSFPQPYHQQQYVQQSLQHLQENYPSHDIPLNSYPNFQSYPSFTESSLPAAPSHYPSYYQGSDASHPPSAPSNMENYPPSTQYTSNGRNEVVLEAKPTSAKTYQYDSNYQPPPDKIAEAHKAARFAVGALAFDDVSIAVDFLKKSLELLTNPSTDL